MKTGISSSGPTGAPGRPGPAEECGSCCERGSCGERGSSRERGSCCGCCRSCCGPPGPVARNYIFRIEVLNTAIHY